MWHDVRTLLDEVLELVVRHCGLEALNSLACCKGVANACSSLSFGRMSSNMQGHVKAQQVWYLQIEVVGILSQCCPIVLEPAVETAELHSRPVTYMGIDVGKFRYNMVPASGSCNS